MLCDENLSDEIIKKALNLKDKAKWKVKNVRSKIRAEENFEEFIKPILYRPFDSQWIFYHEAVVERPRKDVMHNMIYENISLCVGRAGQVVGLERPWNVALCAETIEDFNLFYRGGNVNFPLYLYPAEDLYNGGDTYEREVNVDKKLLEKLAKQYEKNILPEQILYYIYAIC